jgi:hypothetical protein
MLILTLLIAAVLTGLALLHLLWGFGYWYPIRDEAQLVRTVVGARDVDRMPGAIPCAIVSAALIVVVFLLFAPPSGSRTLILSVAAIGLLARGAIAYTKFWRRMTPVEPFATLDRTRYGPLCLALGAGIGILLIAG